jgi:hypothetical protein
MPSEPEEKSMTLEEMLLQKLADWRPDKGRQTLTVPAEGGWRASLTADTCDSVGCRVWELTLDRDTPVADLRAWADRLSSRASGLLEPLRLLELDPAQDTALLRSQAPAKRGETLFYYEVTLKSKGAAHVCRYQASRDGSPREQVAFALTHEALAKLAQDLIPEA